jgi:DNA-binding MarR family transcriptional regulator
MHLKRYPKKQSSCYCLNVRRASRAITQFYDNLLDPCGLKVTQYSLLNGVKSIDPATMNELSTRARLERTTLIRNLRPLQKMGLVDIGYKESSNTRLIRITEKGIKTLEKASTLWSEAQEALDRFIPEEELEVFLKVLKDVESLAP